MCASAEEAAEDQRAVIRRMLASDVAAVLNILSESPEASLWTTASLLEAASRDAAWVATLNDGVVGFLAGRAAADEFELANLAVAGSYRRRGVATELVKAALAWSRRAGALKAFLEVRASNSGAIAFYTRLGFKFSGRRPKYYQSPEEDAVLMCREEVQVGSQTPASFK